MLNFIVWSIVLLILGGAIWYIIRAKKKGVKCIGCSAGAMCSGSCNGMCEGCSNGHKHDLNWNE